jgi:hypothetical protein
MLQWKDGGTEWETLRCFKAGKVHAITRLTSLKKPIGDADKFFGIFFAFTRVRDQE